MKMRAITQFPKNGGEPCPKNLMEVSNCEKEGFADKSVPDCDNKVDCVMSEWQTFSQNCPDCWGGNANQTRSQAAESNINNII